MTPNATSRCVRRLVRCGLMLCADPFGRPTYSNLLAKPGAVLAPECLRLRVRSYFVQLSRVFGSLSFVLPVVFLIAALLPLGVSLMEIRQDRVVAVEHADTHARQAARLAAVQVSDLVNEAN